MAIKDSFSYITYAFYSRYNTVWITNTEIGLDPKNSVKKRLWCMCYQFYAKITRFWIKNFFVQLLSTRLMSKRSVENYVKIYPLV